MGKTDEHIPIEDSDIQIVHEYGNIDTHPEEREDAPKQQSVEQSLLDAAAWRVHLSEELFQIDISVFLDSGHRYLGSPVGSIGLGPCYQDDNDDG